MSGLDEKESGKMETDRDRERDCTEGDSTE